MMAHLVVIYTFVSCMFLIMHVGKMQVRFRMSCCIFLKTRKMRASASPGKCENISGSYNVQIALFTSLCYLHLSPVGV